MMATEQQRMFNAFFFKNVELPRMVFMSVTIVGEGLSVRPGITSAGHGCLERLTVFRLCLKAYGFKFDPF